MTTLILIDNAIEDFRDAYPRFLLTVELAGHGNLQVRMSEGSLRIARLIPFLMFETTQLNGGLFFARTLDEMRRAIVAKREDMKKQKAADENG